MKQITLKLESEDKAEFMHVKCSCHDEVFAAINQLQTQEDKRKAVLKVVADTLYRFISGGEAEQMAAE